MSGVSAKCYATKWYLRRGSNRNDVDDRAKQRDLIRLCLNDREGDLAHIRCLIRLCPNGHAVALVRSLEHVHRLMGSYHNTLFLDYFIESVLEDNEIECFELATRKTIADQIEPLKLLTDIKTFSEGKDFINGIRFYVIVAQPDESEPVYFYHFYTPKKILKRTGLHAILGDKGEYDRIEEKYISFEESIDCISHNGFMFVINKNNFQMMFHFLEEVQATAQETLETINYGLPIQNFDELIQTVNGSKTMFLPFAHFHGGSEESPHSFV